MNSLALCRKTGISKLMVVLTLMALLLSIMPIFSVDAAVKGSLTFYHGIYQPDKYTYGRTVSTEKENSMGIAGKIDYYSGPLAGSMELIPQEISYDCYGKSMVRYPGSVLGSSYFYYFVDGTQQHESTDWWDFDFR